MDYRMFGWFPDPNAKFLEEYIEKNKVKTVIEIGSFVGLSTRFFAERCEHVYAIDPFAHWDEQSTDEMATSFGNDFYQQFLYNMAHDGVLNKITPIRMKSEEAVLNPFLKADLVYIDASHDYDSVLLDISLWLPRARMAICGDDYDAHWPGVGQAVHEMFPMDVEHWKTDGINPLQAGQNLWFKNI